MFPAEFVAATLNFRLGFQSTVKEFLLTRSLGIFAFLVRCVKTGPKCDTIRLIAAWITLH